MVRRRGKCFGGIAGCYIKNNRAIPLPGALLRSSFGAAFSLFPTLPDMKTYFSHRPDAVCSERSDEFRMSRGRDAFTLLEVLVTVLTVALLATLVIPAFSRAQASMQSARCLSNLRQLQQANMAYAASHDGAFVPVFINGASSASEGRVLWTGNADFLSQLGISRAVSSTSDLMKAWPRQMLCPRATIDGGRIDRCYAYNRTGLSALYSKPGASAVVRTAEIARPSRVIAFIDAVNWMMDYDTPLGDYKGEETQSNTVALRHGGRANAVFFDGHAEQLSAERVTDEAELWRIKY